MIRKTAAVTAASIAGVVLAGGAAIGANVGILNAADNGALGTLSADAVITTSSAPAGATSMATVTPTDQNRVQTFAVEGAGTVDLSADDAGLRLVDVQTTGPWRWEDNGSDSEVVSLRFTNGDDTLEFFASSTAEGTVVARVERPTVEPPSPGPTQTPPPRYDQQGDDDEHPEAEHEEDDEHEEHEGREDDD